MQKVVGSSPISRFHESPAPAGLSSFLSAPRGHPALPSAASRFRWHVGLPRMGFMPGKAIVAALVALATVPATAQADWSSTAGPPAVVPAGAGDAPPLIFGYYTGPFHNQLSPFASSTDFNTAALGTQAIGPATPITVNGLGGKDTLKVGNDLSRFSGAVSFDGGAGEDSVTWS